MADPIPMTAETEDEYSMARFNAIQAPIDDPTIIIIWRLVCCFIDCCFECVHCLLKYLSCFDLLVSSLHASRWLKFTRTFFDSIACLTYSIIIIQHGPCILHPIMHCTVFKCPTTVSTTSVVKTKKGNIVHLIISAVILYWHRLCACHIHITWETPIEKYHCFWNWYVNIITTEDSDCCRNMRWHIGQLFLCSGATASYQINIIFIICNIDMQSCNHCCVCLLNREIERAIVEKAWTGNNIFHKWYNWNRIDCTMPWCDYYYYFVSIAIWNFLETLRFSPKMGYVNITLDLA